MKMCTRQGQRKVIAIMTVILTGLSVFVGSKEASAANIAEGEFYSTNDDGNLAYLRSYRNWRQTWVIKAAQYRGTYHSDLLFYDVSNGDLEIYETDGTGRIRFPNTFRIGRGKMVIPGWFGNAYVDYMGFLLYDASAGTGDFYRSDGSGARYHIKHYDNWRKTWTDIIPGNFGGTFHTDLLFYDRFSGDAEIYEIDADGNMRRLNRENYGRDWKIVSGSFGGDHWTDLLLYSSGGGDLKIYTTDGAGNRTLLTDLDWAGGITHIVPGTFGGTKGVLFYTQGARNGEIYTIDEHGNLTLLRSFTNWRTTWTDIIPGAFNGNNNTDLLFYDNHTGH